MEGFHCPQRLTELISTGVPSSKTGIAETRSAFQRYSLTFLPSIADDGKISFLVASHTTECAFKFLHDIDMNNLGMRYAWTYDGYQGISDYLGLESSLGTGKATYFMNRLSEATPSAKQSNTVPPAELFCAPAWQVMQDFRLACGAHREWQGGVYPHLRLSSHPLASILRKAEPTIRCMADVREERHHGFLTDLFTVGLTIISAIGEVPIWCVAQCQILMDIFDALGMQADIGHKALYEAMEREDDPKARKKKIRNLPGMQITPVLMQLMDKLNAMEKESVKYHFEDPSMRCLTELTPTGVLRLETDVAGVAPHLQRYLLTFDTIL